MRLLRLPLPMLLGFLLAMAPYLRAQPAPGHIQVVIAEPGVRVFLDGMFKGVTTAEEGGKILENVPVGQHTIRVVKEGFNPQEAPVRIETDKVFEYRVRPFTPKLEITQQGASAQNEVVQKVGRLLIQTLPVACKITIQQLGMSEVAKDKDEWLANKVPTGSYKAVFSALNKSFSDRKSTRLNSSHGGISRMPSSA